MTQENETMRAALREIENRAAAALADQPGDADECGRHLKKALAVIELKAHVARWGQEGYPPPYSRESPAGGVEFQVPRNGEAEAVAKAVGREAVAQEGTRSNTGQ